MIFGQSKPKSRVGSDIGGIPKNVPYGHYIPAVSASRDYPFAIKDFNYLPKTEIVIDVELIDSS